MARDIIISEEEYYHIYNRGVAKKDIFLDQRDYVRFLLILLLFQSDVIVYNISDTVASYLKTGDINIGAKKRAKILDKRSVKLVAFTSMPNHFHLLVQSTEAGDIARYMHRVQMAYSKYFNAKYKKSGHVFQGTYKAVHIEDNEQLLYASAYIHKNQKELAGWKNKPEQYRWSSFRDYVTESRWGNLLAQSIILDQFKNKEEYFEWVKESAAKEEDDF